MIFSTELARSAPEQIKHPSELRQRLTAARLEEGEAEFAEEVVQELGRSVAVYGMICLRTDGRQALFAQKLENVVVAGQEVGFASVGHGRVGAVGASGRTLWPRLLRTSRSHQEATP